MTVVRRKCFLVFLPLIAIIGCNVENSVPTAPSVKSDEKPTFGKTDNTPPPVMKGKRKIHPGGSGTVEP
jgi:hypothetical protein